MKQVIASLAMALIAPVAFAQNPGETGETKPAQGKRAPQQVQPQQVTPTEKPASQPVPPITRQERKSTETHEKSEMAPQQRMSVDVREKSETARQQPQEHVDGNRHWPVERAEVRGDRRFFHNREIHRHGDRDRSDWHFKIGRHDRAWYYSRYPNVILIDDCWYYEDGGFFYPAYGFDPSCEYPDQYLVFSLN